MSIEDLKVQMQLAEDMEGLNDAIYRIIDARNSVNSRLVGLVNNPFYATTATLEEKARVDSITSVYTQFNLALSQLGPSYQKEV